MIIKAGKQTECEILLASICFVAKKQKYEGMLLIRNRKKYTESDIRVYSKNKAAVSRQLHQIAALFPPGKDVKILDLGVVNDGAVS